VETPTRGAGVMLANRSEVRQNLPVRCGNLAVVPRHVVNMNPESLAGLCGPNRCGTSAGLPSQGPAPLRTWGFSLGECFSPVVGLRPVMRGQGTGGLWRRCRYCQPTEKSICTDPQGGLAMGLYGLHPGNTTGTRITLRDRPGLSQRDRGTLVSSGEQRPADRICASGCAGRVF
jgi:hypothetical protein